jgi:hypothetical protein
MSEERLPELFLEAVELDEAGRCRLLDRLRRDEPLLAVELARLLATPSCARSPIDGSAIVDAREAARHPGHELDELDRCLARLGLSGYGK